MGIFRAGITVDDLNKITTHTMVEHLGIVITSIDENSIEAEMPVDARTHQPFGLLHGGASVALAETLGSIASHAYVNPDTHFCVGLEINANHIKSVRDGFVVGKATPLHIGKTTQVWEIRITKKNTEELICISRITIAVLEKK